MIRVAINGFGRIGRMVFRAAHNDTKIKIVAINDLTDPKTLGYLLKHDSVHRKFPTKVTATNDSLIVGKNIIQVFRKKDPQLLPWKKLKIDVVVESTGFFRTKELASYHLTAGARKVLISANYKGDTSIKTLIKGVNRNTYNIKKDHIISKGSCTTTCLSPIAKVLDDSLGIHAGFMVTTHGVTSSQKIVDAPHKILREGRSVLDNIIPTETGAAIAVTRVIPKLKGKLDGLAMRVPVPSGSVVDFTCTVKRATTVEEVNKIFKTASKKMKGVIEYSEDEIVSTDIIGNTHCAVFDSKLTHVQGKLVKVFAWYDNEYGYASKIVDAIKFIA
jgi:glyceraldehyde 3-phosphate dehydrogenase